LSEAYTLEKFKHKYFDTVIATKMNSIPIFKKALKDPKLIKQFTTRKTKQVFLWNYYYSQLRDPKIIRDEINDEPLNYNELKEELQAKGVNVSIYNIDVADYQNYVQKASYEQFSEYYFGGTGKNFKEKSLEHYLAAKFLNLSTSDVYIDIASAQSPASIIYSKLYGCKVYQQDLEFPPGIHGNMIGGDASNMPVENGFATKLGLHCSFEHFEHDSDIKFMAEASRILKKGGKMCILPLYIYNRYIIRTNPVVIPKNYIFESDVTLYCSKDWTKRHYRHYDVAHFIERIYKNSNDFKVNLFMISNQKEVDQSCYIKFAAVFEKL
jgi:SAM-dependent methyltransferase